MRMTHIADVGETVTGGRWSGRSRHMRYVCRSLMEVELGIKKRTVLQMPPRHGKTTSCALILPFHYLTLYPWREVMYVTHSADLASERGELLRDLINDQGAAFGIGVSSDSKAKDDFDIVNLDGRKTGGSVRCFGVGAGVHGRGCNLLILDDLFKNVEEALSPVVRDSVWRKYVSSYRTRLAPGGAVVSIGTPLHEDDWFGRTANMEGEGAETWDWVKLHALAEEDDVLGREEGEPLWPEGGWDKAELQAKYDLFVASGQLRDWMAQYALKPMSGDGVTEWPARYFDDVLKPWEPKLPYWLGVLSVDTSKGAKAQKKGDWQAFSYCQADGNGHIRCRNELHRLDVKGLRAKAIELYRRWDPTAIVVETNGAGYALLEDLWEAGIPAIGRYHSSHENKVTRITQRLGRAFEAGVLHFDMSPGNKLVLEQARLFPFSKYDDGIDALEMALEFISQARLKKHERNIVYQTKLSA